MKTKMVFMAMLLVTFSGAYGGAVYDFDNGNVTGEPDPGIPLAGQDGWVLRLDPLSSVSVRNDMDLPGFSGNWAAGTGAPQISRINDASFDFGIVGDHIILELISRSDAVLALGSDANGDGDLLDSPEVSFQFSVGASSNYIREAAFGNVYPFSLPSSGQMWRAVIEVDLAANNGDGAGTISVQRLSDNAGNPVDDTLTNVLSNVNLKISRMDDAVESPEKWDAMFVRLGNNSGVDNLTIRGDGVVTPHAYAPSPDPWSFYDADMYAPVDTVLSWKTGRDPNDWTQVNSDIVEHHVYIRDTDNTDPNLYLAAIVSAGPDPISWDPAGSAWELRRGTSYEWCVVEAVDGYTGAQIDDPLIDYDPNNIVSPIAFFRTEPAVPLINVQPESVFSKNGDDTVFTVTATDPLGGTLSYQWRDPADAVIGSDSPMLTISSTTLADEGDYYCIVSNAQGSTSSDAASLTLKRLIGQWFVDGATTDSSGNGNDANAVNGPIVVDGPLDGTSAIQFNGSDQYATVTIDETLNQYKDQYTIAFWVRNDDAPVAGRFIIYGNYYDDADASYGRAHIYPSLTDPPTLNFRMPNKASGTNEIISMPPNEWIHVAAVYDGTGIYLYENGELSSAPSVSGDFSGRLIDVLGEPISFGCRIQRLGGVDTPSLFFKGSMADVRVYNYGMDRWEAAGLYSGITGEDVCVENPAMDLNNDCVVDLYEFSVLASDWLVDNNVRP